MDNLWNSMAVYRAAFRQPGDAALGVGGGGSAPTPPNCRPLGLPEVAPHDRCGKILINIDKKGLKK
jgi:hypothetical protein